MALKESIRKIKKEINQIKLGTKAQLALKLQQEQAAIDRKKYAHDTIVRTKEDKFLQKQSKKKKKHRGK